MAEAEIARLRAHPDAETSVPDTTARKRVFDQIREVSGQVQAELQKQKDRELAAAGRLSIGLVIGISVLFGVIGFVTLERSARRARAQREAEARHRAGQAEFTEMMQVMRDETQAYGLVKNHLERSIPGGVVTVLSRNNSDNRLVATTAVPEGSPLAAGLEGAGPGRLPRGAAGALLRAGRHERSARLLHDLWQHRRGGRLRAVARRRRGDRRGARAERAADRRPTTAPA